MATHAGTRDDVVEQTGRRRARAVRITYLDAEGLRAALERHRLRVVDLRSRAPRDHEHPTPKLLATAVATSPLPDPLRRTGATAPVIGLARQMS